MKRLHVHVGVNDLDQSIKFYSALFAAEPTVTKTDYAKWMLEDPRVNFAISTRQDAGGVRHLGIQVENADELQEVYARLKRADAPTFEEGKTTCCYAKSEKRGSTIRKAWRGKLSSLPGKRPPMAAASRAQRQNRTPRRSRKPAARRVIWKP